MKNIAILGSTGSIGTQTLDVARKNEDLRVVAVSAGKSGEKLEEQIREFHPILAAVWDEKAARDLKTRIADTDTKVVSGMEGLLELASMPESDILVTAIVGMIGIRPTMEGIRAGKDIALANKETLVTAGHLIMPMAREYGVSILPVDSEHSAIFQAIHGEENKEIHKLLITASGGPFRGRTTEELPSGATSAILFCSAFPSDAASEISPCTAFPPDAASAVSPCAILTSDVLSAISSCAAPSSKFPSASADAALAFPASSCPASPSAIPPELSVRTPRSSKAKTSVGAADKTITDDSITARTCFNFIPHPPVFCPIKRTFTFRSATCI